MIVMCAGFCLNHLDDYLKSSMERETKMVELSAPFATESQKAMKDHHERQQELETQRVQSCWHYAGKIVGYALGVSIAGAVLWYVREQRHRDAVARYQAEMAIREAERRQPHTSLRRKLDQRAAGRVRR